MCLYLLLVPELEVSQPRLVSRLSSPAVGVKIKRYLKTERRTCFYTENDYLLVNQVTSPYMCKKKIKKSQMYGFCM